MKRLKRIWQATKAAVAALWMPGYAQLGFASEEAMKQDMVAWIRENCLPQSRKGPAPEYEI